MTADTFLHGVRTTWAQAPAEVRDWLLERTGALVAEPEDRSGGMATGLAVVLHGSHGDVFAKAIDAVDNPHGAGMYRREAEYADRLPVHPRIPALIASGPVALADGGSWWVNMLEARPGSTVAHPWSGSDLDRVLAAWSELRPALRATPWTRSAELLTGWRQIAADPDDPWHPLAQGWAGREQAMADLVDGGPGAVLSHVDLRADNLVIGPAPSAGIGDVAIVDWAHPGTAAPWADVAILLADVVGSGAAVECGGDIDVVETFARDDPDTDPELAVALITALGAFLHRRAWREPVDPALPHRHTWSAAMADRIGRFATAHAR